MSFKQTAHAFERNAQVHVTGKRFNVRAVDQKFDSRDFGEIGQRVDDRANQKFFARGAADKTFQNATVQIDNRQTILDRDATNRGVLRENARQVFFFGLKE